MSDETYQELCPRLYETGCAFMTDDLERQLERQEITPANDHLAGFLKWFAPVAGVILCVAIITYVVIE